MVATDTSLISQLWRYPFKSMGGECISRTVISQTGVLGDRRWAVRKEIKQAMLNSSQAL